MQIGVLFFLERLGLKILIFLEELLLLHLMLLKFLVNLILLLYKLNNFAHTRSVQYPMHSSITKVPQNQRNRIQKYDIDIVVAQFLGFGEGLLDLLKDEEINLIQILYKSLIEIFLHIVNMRKQSLQKPIQPYHRSKYPIDPKILT